MIAMMFSDDRKFTLSGWLQVHERKVYDRPYQLQIFLLLYEFISKIENDEWDLWHLFGLEKGPVYGAVLMDYSKICDRFHRYSKSTYEEKIIEVNDDRAKRCAFMVQTRTEEEWSSFTKRLNLWKAKESEIFKLSSFCGNISMFLVLFKSSSFTNERLVLILLRSLLSTFPHNSKERSSSLFMLINLSILCFSISNINISTVPSFLSSLIWCLFSIFSSLSNVLRVP